jgi:hypothetical protein
LQGTGELHRQIPVLGFGRCCINHGLVRPGHRFIAAFIIKSSIDKAWKRFEIAFKAFSQIIWARLSSRESLIMLPKVQVLADNCRHSSEFLDSPVSIGHHIGIKDPINETARSFHMALSPSASGIRADEHVG